MAYCDFFNKIDSNQIKTIFELGSRDLIDAIKLLDYFKNSKTYAFECNHDCLIECHNNMHKLDEITKERLILVDKAVSINNGKILFYPFDLKKYNNML